MTFVIESPNVFGGGAGSAAGPFVVTWCSLRLIRSFLANTQDKRTLARATLRERA
ncbi:hypothetical protein GCM10025789_24510 [Tessaracoccus lubricantis]|uniref:Uncharacterized protein n=1 Tax=Tessaracoccus lubricantis TaxID=545543 RepID=A0ABP9FK01_9ACTN